VDWERAYRRLEEAKYNGRIVNNRDTIKKIQRLNEWHREMFMEYFNDFLEENNNLSTFKSFRKPILDFLLKDKINIKKFSDITQIDIDDFLENILGKVTENTFNHNKYALKNYLDFHSKHLNFTPEYIGFNRAEINSRNKMETISSKELEDIRFIIKNEPYLEFMFELAYENGIRFEDSREYNMKNYDEEKGQFISITGQPIEISQKLRNIIDKIKNSDEFRNPYYKQGFSIRTLKEVLLNKKFKRKIKSRDVNEAYKHKTSFKCPECGASYEATADNWVIKQYHEGGQLWIVCKERCGGNNADL
jgi:hypothetical protein